MALWQVRDQQAMRERAANAVELEWWEKAAARNNNGEGQQQPQPQPQPQQQQQQPQAAPLTQQQLAMRQQLEDQIREREVRDREMTHAT